MTPLPSRLRASAQAMRGLSPCTERSYEILDLVAWNIAAELEEAAQALEAGRGEPVAWRVRGHAFDFNTDEPRLWHYYTGSRRPTVGVPYRCDIEPLYAAPAAQVAQEGAPGVALPAKPFPAPGKWFPVDITGTRPMREVSPGKWELAEWPSDDGVTEKEKGRG